MATVHQCQSLKRNTYAVLARISAGERYEEVAGDFGVTANAVSKFALRHGIRQRAVRSDAAAVVSSLKPDALVIALRAEIARHKAIVAAAVGAGDKITALTTALAAIAKAA